MRRQLKKDAQPLGKESLLDLLHGDVKNLCEKIKHQRKAEIAESIEQKSQKGEDQYAQFRTLANELRVAAGQVDETMIEETKTVPKKAQA